MRAAIVLAGAAAWFSVKGMVVLFPPARRWLWW
jgi:hypothetical protein